MGLNESPPQSRRRPPRVVRAIRPNGFPYSQWRGSRAGPWGPSCTPPSSSGLGMLPAAISLGAASAIDALVTEWREGIATTGRVASTTGAPPRSSRVSGAALRRMVWDPIANRLGDSTRVFIVPDGALSLVPFAALPIGPRSFRLETGPVIHYVSAERDVVPGTRRGCRTRPVGRRWTIPSTAVRLARRSCRHTRLHRRSRQHPSAGRSCAAVSRVSDFNRLKEPFREVQEVSRLWSASATSSGDTDSAQLLVGREASEAAFKLAAQHYRVLHLATHGVFPRRLLRSGTDRRHAGCRGLGVPRPN